MWFSIDKFNEIKDYWWFYHQALMTGILYGIIDCHRCRRVNIILKHVLDGQSASLAYSVCAQGCTRKGGGCISKHCLH